MHIYPAYSKEGCHPYTEHADLLLDHKANAAIHPKAHKTPWDVALKQPEMEVLFARYSNKPLASRLTPGRIAAKHGNIKARVRRLKLNRVNGLLLGSTLPNAASHKPLGLNRKADVNATHAQGHAPLMLAVKHDPIELTWELIKK